MFTLLISLPAMTWAQNQDCKEKPSDLASKAAIQVDTIRIVDPETRERTQKIIHMYHNEEKAIVERKTIGNKTYAYIEKDDCLVIRHVTEVEK
jgi:hypothetical protein